MRPEKINPNIRNYLRVANFTTEEDIDRILRIGVVASHASQFLEHIALYVGAEGVYYLNEFYRNFLGMYNLISVDKSHEFPVIRLCNQISPNGQDGVQLEFRLNNLHWHIKLCRLTATFDTTIRTELKEYR